MKSWKLETVLDGLRINWALAWIPLSSPSLTYDNIDGI